jgi:hypothetical protein
MILTSLSPERKKLLENNLHLTEDQTTKDVSMREEKKEETITGRVIVVMITDVTKDEMMIVVMTTGPEFQEIEITTHVNAENSTVTMIEKEEKIEEALKEKTDAALKEKMTVSEKEQVLERVSIEKEENQEKANQENLFHSQLKHLSPLLLETCRSLLFLMICINSSLPKTARLLTSESLLAQMESSRVTDTSNLRI